MAFSPAPFLGSSSLMQPPSCPYLIDLPSLHTHLCFLLDELAGLLGKTDEIHIHVMGQQNDICIFFKNRSFIIFLNIEVEKGYRQIRGI